MLCIILLLFCCVVSVIQSEEVTTNCFDVVLHLMEKCQNLNKSEEFFNNPLQPSDISLNPLKERSIDTKTEPNSYYDNLSDVCQKLSSLLRKSYIKPITRLQFKSSPTTYEARYSPEELFAADNSGHESESGFSALEEDESLYGAGRGGVRFNGNSKVEPRIIGGQVVDPGEIPYQVALYKLDIFVCGSSLISQFFVLTAAHCLQRVLPNELWFRVGSESLILGGQTYRVADFVIHNRYTNADYDIGLIRSASAVEFGPMVKAIALPSKHDEVLAGTSALASGWGATENTNGLPAYQLHKIQLKMVSKKRCKNRIMASVRIITSRQTCTTAPVNAGTCFGDSGGPLVVNRKLVGIVSWGSPCAIGDPDVYTNVRAFLPWIYQQMKRLNQHFELIQAPSHSTSYSYLSDPYNYDVYEDPIYY